MNFWCSTSISSSSVVPSLLNMVANSSSIIAKSDEETHSPRGVPAWLSLLLQTKFFQICEEHKDLKKSELNTYCINCDKTMCQHCQMLTTSSNYNSHRKHKLIQIRRYVYQSVVRLHDIHKLIDCSKIQLFTVNSARVLLLNPKSNGKASGGKEGQACEFCQRSITEPNRFCSIACKVLVHEKDQHENSGPSLSSSTSYDIDQETPSVKENSPPNGSDSNDNHTNLEKSPGKIILPRRRRRKGVPRRSPFF